MHIQEGWTYDDYVTAGLRVLSRSYWDLGDLASALDTHWGEATLERYAADLGLGYHWLRQLRWVCRAYPQNERHYPFCFSVYRFLASQADRFELLASRDWTAEQARELIRSRNHGQDDDDDPDTAARAREAAEAVARAKAEREARERAEEHAKAEKQARADAEARARAEKKARADAEARARAAAEERADAEARERADAKARADKAEADAAEQRRKAAEEAERRRAAAEKAERKRQRAEDAERRRRERDEQAERKRREKEQGPRLELYVHDLCMVMVRGHISWSPLLDRLTFLDANYDRMSKYQRERVAHRLEALGDAAYRWRDRFHDGSAKGQKWRTVRKLMAQAEDPACTPDERRAFERKIKELIETWDLHAEIPPPAARPRAV
ncbi:MAG: hypothetical protein WB974_09395 [Acidobacteriaceae bacterium]